MLKTTLAALYSLFLTPITANESKMTMWILIAVVAIAATGGAVYFIINNNKKK